MLIERLPKFYNEEVEAFVQIVLKIQNLGDELKLSNLLGEDVDNPKITFRTLECLLDVNYMLNQDRIRDLDKRLLEYKKQYDVEKQKFENIKLEIEIEADNIEKEFYFTVKENFNKLIEEIEEQKSYNLLLQKQLTSLKKEKVDLQHQVTLLNNKLDAIEKDLGISLKRTKKK